MLAMTDPIVFDRHAVRLHRDRAGRGGGLGLRTHRAGRKPGPFEDLPHGHPDRALRAGRVPLLGAAIAAAEAE